MRTSTAAVLLLLAGAVPAGAQVAPGVDSLPTDSAALHDLAVEVQTNFERYREARIPPSPVEPGRACDERVGRFCLRHEGDDDPIPSEPPEVGLARSETLSELARIARRIPGDRWILGQRVFYLLEADDVRAAEGLARRCEGGPEWWCGALLGYVLHETDRPVEAEETFREAVAGMPEDVAAEYRSPRYLLDEAGREAFEEAEPGERRELWRRLWLLSDPLYLVEGNDRLTAHWARRTLVRIRRGGWTPYGIPYDEDLSELNIRYGGERGWERVMGGRGFGGGVRDTRRVIGRHHPKDREYLPDGSFLADPADMPPGGWTLEEWKPKTGYAAPYALDMTPLATQVARLRRGDSLLVVASYRAGGATSRAEPRRADRQTGERRGDAPDRPANPFLPADPPPTPEPDAGASGGGAPGGGPGGPVETGLFLLDWSGDPVHAERGSASRDVLTARVPNGEYVFGLEVREEEASRAWRTRQGLRQEGLAPGQSAVSDLLFLRADGPPPSSLEEALPRVLPSIRVRAGDTFTVAWELYGLRPGETARVTLGFDQGEPSFLERVGEFLRIVEEDEPVEVEFEEQAPERLGTIFRAINVDIPSFEPGVYTLRLAVQLPGRTPMVTSRRLVVEE